MLIELILVSLYIKCILSREFESYEETCFDNWLNRQDSEENVTSGSDVSMAVLFDANETGEWSSEEDFSSGGEDLDCSMDVNVDATESRELSEKEDEINNISPHIVIFGDFAIYTCDTFMKQKACVLFDSCTKNKHMLSDNWLFICQDDLLDKLLGQNRCCRHQGKLGLLWLWGIQGYQYQPRRQWKLGNEIYFPTIFLLK